MQSQQAGNVFDAKWVAELGLMTLRLPRKHPESGGAQDALKQREPPRPSAGGRRQGSC